MSRSTADRLAEWVRSMNGRTFTTEDAALAVGHPPTAYWSHRVTVLLGVMERYGMCHRTAIALRDGHRLYDIWLSTYS